MPAPLAGCESVGEFEDSGKISQADVDIHKQKNARIRWAALNLDDPTGYGSIRSRAQ